MFSQHEQENTGFSLALSEALDAIKWNANGLIPVIAQQHDSKEVLMLAWMNRAALEETLRHGRMCYWSRSRQTFWRKGESSGQVQMLVSLSLDCDADTLLAQVDQTGPACHTGRRSCFYWRFHNKQLQIDTDPLINPEELYSSS
ncbi:MAG TPA: phosphoribosyl-AMP cyclohydrolase [Alcanivoracaceae bacterium]|nr:phosphoribosyl-AMP cyclohydrolase [Alcanivoracaceae bacterium]